MDVTKFNRGEMYWYINKDVKKEDYLKNGQNQDFLDSRPVLIISNYVDEYDSSVIIIPTTTSDHRYGIDITMSDEKGEIVSTKLMPMRQRYIPIKYLKTFIGKLDDAILEKVYDAIDYHYGRTNIIPDYVIKDKEMHVKLNNKNKSESKDTDISKSKEEDKISCDKVELGYMINGNYYAPDFIIYKGTIGNNGTVTTLPEDHEAGWMYKVITSNKYAGIDCSVDDAIVCVKGGKTPSDSDWFVIKTKYSSSIICRDLTYAKNKLKNMGMTNITEKFNIKSFLYKTFNANKNLRKKYESIKSFKDKYEYILSDNTMVAAKLCININQAISIKKLCAMEIAIEQKILIDKIMNHDINMNQLSDKQKIVFLTYDDNDIVKCFKKGKPLIDFYRSQFRKDIFKI